METRKGRLKLRDLKTARIRLLLAYSVQKLWAIKQNANESALTFNVKDQSPISANSRANIFPQSDVSNERK